MNKIDSIIYFDDPEDMFRFKPENMSADQIFYSEGIQRTSTDFSTEEIRHVISLINDCHDFRREPSDKFRTFPKHIARYRIPLEQDDIEGILQELPSEPFCKADCSTDAKTWKKTFLKFEFCNYEHRFSNGRSLSGYLEHRMLFGYLMPYIFPFVIYIVIADNLTTNKTAALVSFTSYDFEKCMLAWDSNKRVNLNYIEKSGSVYLVSVVARPYSAEDPFLEFFISEGTYNKIIHLIEGLTVKLQMNYPVHYRCDAYKTYVKYQSLDPVNHGLPVPVKYFFRDI